MEDNEWIHNEWDAISERVAKAERDLDESEKLAKKLLIDIEFLRIMFDEDML